MLLIHAEFLELLPAEHAVVVAHTLPCGGVDVFLSLSDQLRIEKSAQELTILI